MYWKNNDGTDILRPNGFDEYPTDVYNLFLSLIDHDGKVLDLGCGNGLLLRHLITNSKYKLIPYGVDFIEESIKQAKEKILPEFAENFTTANIIDYDLKESSFDFILFDPYHLHPKDIPKMTHKIIKACRKNGKVIFYTYKDVLTVLKIINLLKLKWISWVGDLLPKEIGRKLKRINHKEVSVGVYEK
ncbi:MAG: class I SAM-dependent methyltransferase [Candidatus Asgardarchaeum sp.]